MTREQKAVIRAAMQFNRLRIARIPVKPGKHYAAYNAASNALVKACAALSRKRRARRG